jgi:ABC-type branched-subunit amino acid transport system substrate-binding protein
MTDPDRSTEPGGIHMTGRFRSLGRVVALVGAVALMGVIAVPSAGAGGKFPKVDQPGVTDNEIKVAGVATISNDPTGNNLGDSFDGAEAYFKYVNSTGGVYGRKLVLDSKRDDALANNRAEVQGILTQDDPFAVLPVAVDLFSGADALEQAGMPTFGVNIQSEWGSEDNKPGPANFFGQFGSFHCFTCGLPTPMVWLAKKLGLEKVGILAYQVPQSAACATGLENSFKRYPVAKVVYLDKSLAFGNPDYSAQVAKMKEEGVDYVITCIDGNGTVSVAKEMKKQGLDAIQILPNAYSHELIAENADFLDGYYGFTPFAPLETKPQPPGLKLYEKWIKKTGGARDEHSLDGWLNAGLLVAGLEAAGPDFTQQKVIDAINKMTDYRADGLLPGVDWTVAHQQDPACYSMLKIVDGKFKPVFGKPGKPFICLPNTLKTLPLNPQVTG